MEKENQVETFCEITSSQREEALFFLESHNWDLDSAVSTYFENNILTTTATATTSNNNIDDDDSGGDGEGDGDDNDSDYDPSSPSPTLFHPSNFLYPAAMVPGDKNPPKYKPSSTRSGGIRTLSDLNRSSDPGSDSDSDGPPEYYTGGEKSGMLVQDPSKNNDVDAIFDQARQLGAMEGPADHVRPSSSSRSFTGTGRLLSGETVPVAPQQPEAVVHNIVFWSNGFTVNDGPLRSLDDPENASILESIRKSECPKELEPADRRSTVHVNLTRRDENCPEPEKHRVPFQGVGRTLGSSSTTAATPEQTPEATSLNTAPAPYLGLTVDERVPSTSIQLRLVDGTRMIARFNYHHTIGDVRAFIDASRPGGPTTYHLQTVGFPPKQLVDVTQTIEQAGLANSVVIQKL